MQRILLFTCLFTGSLFLHAQANGNIQFEIDTNPDCFELETGFDAGAGHTIIGVNVHIASLASGVPLGDRANYPVLPLDDSDADGIYTLNYQPNGTTGNNEFRWYFEAEVSRPGLADTVINEFLGNDYTDDAQPATTVWACKIRFAGGPVRTFYMNGPQDRKIRNALGKCLMCGDQEWNVTMDMAALSSDPATTTNVAFIPAANRHVSLNGSFAQLNMVNNGDNTYSLRIPVGVNEYIVFSFQANFSITEGTALAAGTAVKTCDVFPWGSREYFENASTDIKFSDYLWASYSTTVPGAAVEPFAAGTTVTADKAVNLDGTTTYYLANNKQLLAIDWGAETPAAAADVSVTFGSSEAEWVPNGTGFIGNETGGAAILKRTWNVNGSITNPVNVRFFFTQAELDAINTVIAANGGTGISGVADMEFFKVTSGEDPQVISDLSPEDVVIYDNGASSTNTFAEGGEDLCATSDEPASTIFIDHMVESFSGGGGGAADGGAMLLPVELAMLTASALKSDVMVKWATASESGNEGFEVEHSTDGTDFRSVGRVAGAGTSTTYLNYDFEHVNAPAGVNFYRLKQTDLTGASSLSQVVTAVVEGSNALSVYPNPATNELFVAGAEPNGVVEIRDANGRSFGAKVVADSNGSLNVADLAPGLYFATVRNGTETATLRFVKR